MPRPQAFTDDALLTAAREVFLERGILATTAEVAARAGVAEGTLFYRFKTKAGLFQAAMRSDMEEPQWLPGLPARVGSPDLPATLIELGRGILAHFRKAVPLLMMQWSNPPPARTTPPGPAGEHVPARAVRLLADYFAAEMRAGRLRQREPEVVARVFLGSFLHYAFHEAMSPAAAPSRQPAETYVREVVTVLLEGIEPTASATHLPTPAAEASRPRRPSAVPRGARKKGEPR